MTDPLSAIRLLGVIDVVQRDIFALTTFFKDLRNADDDARYLEEQLKLLQKVISTVTEDIKLLEKHDSKTDTSLELRLRDHRTGFRDVVQSIKSITTELQEIVSRNHPSSLKKRAKFVFGKEKRLTYCTRIEQQKTMLLIQQNSLHR